MKSTKAKLAQARKDLFVITCIAVTFGVASVTLAFEVLELLDTIDLLKAVR